MEQVLTSLGRTLSRMGFSRFYRWFWIFLALQVGISIPGFVVEAGKGVWLSLWFVSAVFWLISSFSLVFTNFGTGYFDELNLAPWPVKLGTFGSVTLLFVLCAWPLFK